MKAVGVNTHTPNGWCVKMKLKLSLLHKLITATKNPRIVFVFFFAHVYECRCHLFVFRTTAAASFAALSCVWSLLPLHSVIAAFLLSVTIKPLWSTVYSHSFGTLCPSSPAATQWLSERLFFFFLNFYSSFVVIGFDAVSKQLFTWAEELRQLESKSFSVSFLMKKLNILSLPLYKMWDMRWRIYFTRKAV